ncbi:uncharacterized protein LY89DRAFT_672211 [Mollisia scopiformis]|uniref:Uncharacterized protein n=1 Tax=Mollisia scopiformis TaxID=149040 RepID=A0A194X176_MOLSC|nr:uncharacterized protein LY89DRAFT_672211 [Mollisia scopiformis]KUJ13945.1 hypothetical protein LY89DRAFT_672211 [Mollisia scopiformis]
MTSTAPKTLYPIRTTGQSSNAGPNTGNNEGQTYTSNTTNNVSLNGSGILYIEPQKDGNGHWKSARLEGKSAFSCPAGHRMLLQAEIRTGTFPYSSQAGIRPAFRALGKDDRNDGKNLFTVTAAQVNDPVLSGNVAHKAFFPILNVAVGSNFPNDDGQPDGNTVNGPGSGMQVKSRTEV